MDCCHNPGCFGVGHLVQVARYETAVDVGPKCPSRTAEVTPACATAVLMSGKVWPIWGTDPRGRKTTYGEFAGQKVHYVM